MKSRTEIRRAEEQLKQICWGRAATLEEGWEALKHLVAPPEPDKDPGDPEEPNGNPFVPYVPAKLRGGKPHPAVILESASMAAVTPLPEAAAPTQPIPQTQLA